ncbi:regulator of chromosome condensation 1/beta-lactamase-inhibitor protein II [Lophiotrema nucula]|uniref:Regulator of chromosome condensation 1/beta-lactamase-inhibitor protein II n=1 Tax=Lophiotrema nucula TaxID=690887 RepID=A0A6A5ZB13_9PLEO|nr:regulator of chromosome condensation 1/beta-lactamase-inhibitor protein II [Lophiotrema nucula]
MALMSSGTGRTRGLPKTSSTTVATISKRATVRGRAKKVDEPVEAEPPTAKRKKDADESDGDAVPEQKRAKRVTPQPKKPKIKGPLRRGGKKTIVNQLRYTRPFKAFVFGEGSSGELGLGSSSKAIDVKRPRLNPNLADADVVQVSCGGMHVVALTKDNRILTWGVNDNGALGRDTSNAPVKMIDIDDADSDASSDSDPGLNELEATPIAIPAEYFPEDTEFVDVAAGDSCSFFLTTEGAVYGCGTFRKNEGVLGFARGVDTARRPMYISELKKITQIACGTNHVLALDADGHMWAWGNGQQCQLGRRITERGIIESLVPTRLGFNDSTVRRPSKQIVKIICGDYHAFAIAKDGHVWSWGANNYAEAAQPDNAGEDNASVSTPTVVHALEGCKVVDISGGLHHNIALTSDGDCLIWGRCDGSQTGIPLDELSKIDDDAVVLKTETTNKPKILIRPTVIPGLRDIAFVAAGPEHTIVLNKAGRAYSWGFSANYQTGQGSYADVDTPTLIDNTATREEKLVFAGAGGQYSIVASYK